jgi:hypothetical protein
MKLFIAGAESKQVRICNGIANSPSMLLSYYHLAGKQHRIPADFKSEYHSFKKGNTSFIMDSGLFTMMFGAGSNQTYEVKELEEYTERYLANVKEMQYEDYIVEMDVHKLFGLKELAKFRKRFVNNYPIDKTIFVWHIEEEIDGWQQMCQTYPYVAISVPELRIVLERKFLKGFIQKMVAEAHKINPQIKIHLLGCTSHTLLSQPGYYSADSTSWLQAVKYGTLKVPHIKGGGIHFDEIAALESDTINKRVKANTKILKTKYNLEYVESQVSKVSAISIAAYKLMATELNQEYFNQSYEGIDEQLTDLL